MVIPGDIRIEQKEVGKITNNKISRSKRIDIQERKETEVLIVIGALKAIRKDIVKNLKT